MREIYKKYDAAQKFEITLKETLEKTKIRTCICSEILLGKKLLGKCDFFERTGLNNI
ncbi:hydrogenase maturation factor [Clostridium saccharobutylicum]|uniref:Hydrogenase maturation factor n=1 Tax=Clostridium saccharobutylicum DSM 13864 TaxID=1345695 RepID=U5MR57_CLOSA|nr:hydrogenase maturation factor [Clostridium saccharobutylicum]AGX43294.1 hydrogenase maturation factor [Clostridium saccharobutylicum DSM 13864]AQR90595.1 hydrogenase formation hypA family protein [Clostridium saccharobutylicum]AQS00499.1 hydrogenase formation hypA family protein [Clostridium saccharobutylicum]AQS10149.1 hydrogenase formation hypA family protein [Clostridium saccharobutylicum]AQS14482.1 hydrogenase formation hypA family protein [Clostridium saccharobutylicum]